MNKDYIYNMDFVREQSNKELFNVVSLFAGGGGSSTGYRLAGAKVLAINEFVPAAQEVYHFNYPDTHIFTEDIRELKAEDILTELNLKKGELDILDGSPPCASFSTAGLREKGWGRIKKYSDKEQRTDDLFFEFSRILNDLQPKVFVAENVKGLTIGAAANLLGGEQKDLFDYHEKTIYQTLIDCGYQVRYEVINSKNYGVPQSRARTIFIGVRNDLDYNITFPKFDTCTDTVEEATKDLEFSGNVCTMGDTYKEYWRMTQPNESFYDMGKRLKIHSTGLTRIRLDKDRICPTIIATPSLYHWNEERTLTIEEVVRLSSFPSDYYLGESNTKKWERVGRAVPPLMYKAVAENIYNTILKDL
jgi:DNA (cytosine-5)-methyltransferase 1